MLGAMAPTAMAGTYTEIVPRIPPGYEPELNKDERGLWMEFEELEEALRRSPLLVRDPVVNTYVKDVACRVAGRYCQDLRIYVMRNPGFNASMAANGMMQVWTGLLIRVGSEDELASVLGHEVAHYAMAHSLSQFRRIRTTMGLGSLVSLGVGVATGVLLPVGELGAMVDALAFSREQETEADRLGAQFMDISGYDPHASYLVWEHLLAEEAEAVVKRDERSIFMSTHPATDGRIEELKEWVPENYGPPRGLSPTDRHREAVGSQYFIYMEDQIDTNRYGRTSYLLKRHAELGVRPGLIEFFRGEMHRQRAADGDNELASAAYRASIDAGDAPAEAYRNLGYLQLKAGDNVGSQAMFRRYLELRPDASDREMIEFYIGE